MQQFTYNKIQQQKAYRKRLNGVKSRWAADGNTVLLTPVRNKDKAFNAPTVLHGLKARRGRCVLSHEKRLMILNAREDKAKLRAAFFADLAALV